jgi:hypothetical protein
LKEVEQAGTFSFLLLLECLFGGKTQENTRLRCKDTWIAHMAVETKRQALNLGLYQFTDVIEASDKLLVLHSILTALHGPDS